MSRQQHGSAQGAGAALACRTASLASVAVSAGCIYTPSAHTLQPVCCAVLRCCAVLCCAGTARWLTTTSLTLDSKRQPHTSRSWSGSPPPCWDAQQTCAGRSTAQNTSMAHWSCAGNTPAPRGSACSNTNAGPNDSSASSGLACSWADASQEAGTGSQAARHLLHPLPACDSTCCATRSATGTCRSATSSADLRTTSCHPCRQPRPP